MPNGLTELVAIHAARFAGHAAVTFNYKVQRFRKIKAETQSGTIPWLAYAYYLIAYAIFSQATLLGATRRADVGLP